MSIFTFNDYTTSYYFSFQPNYNDLIYMFEHLNCHKINQNKSKAKII